MSNNTIIATVTSELRSLIFFEEKCVVEPSIRESLQNLVDNGTIESFDLKDLMVHVYEDGYATVNELVINGQADNFTVWTS